MHEDVSSPEVNTSPEPEVLKSNVAPDSDADTVAQEEGSSNVFIPTKAFEDSSDIFATCPRPSKVEAEIVNLPEEEALESEEEWRWIPGSQFRENNSGRNVGVLS
jgi:hypothetical protein